MSQLIIKLVITAFMFVTSAGCASIPAKTPEHEVITTESDKSKMRMVWTVGAILIVGALLLNEAEDGVKDSVRQISLP